jgi:GNAT superfamily N-acetyltransferase
MQIERCSANAFTSKELCEEATGQDRGGALILRLSDNASSEVLAVLGCPHKHEAELERLYVPQNLRKQGLGTRALITIEKYCRENGIAVLRVWAKPLDDDTEHDRLISWYKRNGYRESGRGPAELQKVLEP